MPPASDALAGIQTRSHFGYRENGLREACLIPARAGARPETGRAPVQSLFSYSPLRESEARSAPSSIAFLRRRATATATPATASAAADAAMP